MSADKQAGEPREEVSPNGVAHLVIGRWCLTCGDLHRHKEWPQ